MRCGGDWCATCRRGRARGEWAADLLEQNNIPSLVRDIRSSAFPTTVGRTGEKRIVVDKAKAEEARALIQEAIDDEAIAASGTFL